MNKYSLIIPIIIFIFISCTSKTREYNRLEIKNQVETAEKLVVTCDNNIQSAIETENFEYIGLITKRAIDSCDIIVNKLKLLEVYPEQNNLKTVSISYILTLKDIVITEQEYSKLTDSTSLVEASKMDDRLMKASVKSKNEYVKYKNSLEKN